MKFINVLRHVQIVSLLVVLIGLIRFLAEAVEPIDAKIISSEIYEGSSARGAGSPVVRAYYLLVGKKAASLKEFVVDGKMVTDEADGKKI